jgi:hypothetical protein
MKCKLLLDENLPPRTKFIRLNNRFCVQHIVHDLRKSGISDKELFKIAEKLGSIIITLNERHFNKNIFIKSGLIGLSPYLSTEDIDKKVTSILTKHKTCYLTGKSIHVGR